MLVSLSPVRTSRIDGPSRRQVRTGHDGRQKKYVRRDGPSRRLVRTGLLFVFFIHLIQPLAAICLINVLRGVYSDTTQLTRLNSVQPSQSCFFLFMTSRPTN